MADRILQSRDAKVHVSRVSTVPLLSRRTPEEFSLRWILTTQLANHTGLTNKLYRNDGHHLTDVTKALGLDNNQYGIGVIVGDYDGDGCRDLYLTNFGSNVLCRNDGDGTFTDVT